MSENSAEHVVVLGGGVIGAMCAWYLSEAGHRVTIVDQGKFGSACSHGNCGYICPSHVLPLAVPGAVRRSLRALLQPNSPFRIKPRISPALWRWLLRFARLCNETDMLQTARALHPLLQHSLRLYRELIESQALACEWQERGLLFVYASPREFEHYAATDHLLREQFGMAATPYDARQLVQLEPALKPGLGGAWHYRGDCHLRPDKLMSELRTHLAKRRVAVLEGIAVERLVADGGRARGLVGRVVRDSTSENSSTIEGDAFVVATGAWAPFFARHLGCSIPIQPGKGYSLTMPAPDLAPRIPLIFEEHRVAVTPMQTGYRLGSMMEFAGYDRSINRHRLSLLRSAAEHYLIEPYRDPVEEQWYGWRPMTWDSRPIIDRSPRYHNVWIAAGHSMLGLTLATATGKLIADLIDNRIPLVDPRPFSVARFGL